MSQMISVFNDQEWQCLAGKLSLTPRQLDISRCLFKGFSDKKISSELGISISTVRTHLSRLFEKTNTQDRVSFILFLTENYISDCRAIGCPQK
ncbi:MAG TPA: LuxR family transcriptional regulator [Phycisphaerae bacterium]|nr:LuxR family transcriptional regulator [Phycisphaerae bacterium]